MDNGADTPDGVDGEIAARGPGMFLGYADEEQNGRCAPATMDFS